MSEYITDIGKRSKAASYVLGRMNTEQKNYALICIADAIENCSDQIITANEKDMENAKNAGVSPALLDRLKLDDARIKAMSEGLRQVVELEDPVGEILSRSTLENGLHINKVRVPMGVVGIIYESRPNVTADAFGLCFKTGNAVILRGGSDAINSNKILVDIIRDALSKQGIDPNAVILIENTDRVYVNEFIKLNEYVDVLIPRGGAGLIRNVLENATIPVIETGTGNCHVYVDESADYDMAVNIIINAKTQRYGVCNACESLLVHESVARDVIPMIYKALNDKDVEIRASQDIFEISGSECPKLVEASEDDWGREYLGPIISARIVSSVDEAIAHINRYSTHHSESIVTNNSENAERFLNEVDAACVYVNASTRFTDGFEFGLGAEIGISTQKLHARGPMGLSELTTYKYKVYGNGQIRK